MLERKREHLITIPRILKCIEVICGISITICIQCSWASYLHQGVFVTIVSSIGAVLSAILFGLHLFRKADRLAKLEFVFYVLWTILYLIATILTARFDMARELLSYISVSIQETGKLMPQGLYNAALKIKGELLFRPKKNTLLAIFSPKATETLSMSTEDWEKMYVATSRDVGSDIAIVFGAVATVVHGIDAFLVLVAIR